MKKKIKIWFHTGTTSDIKEFSFNRSSLIIFILFAALAMTGVSYTGYDYFKLKKTAFDNAGLSDTLDKQHHEIKSQRDQIQSFADQIEQLKNKLDRLSKFEDKVRLIADIKQTSDLSGLIGIGGIPKETLDSDIPLDQMHNSLIREMHQQIEQTSIAAIEQALDFEDLIKGLEEKRNLLARTPSIKPADGWITSRFGYRKSPFTGKREFHAGLDIANRIGAKVIATADGKVIYASKKLYIGNLVTIDHGHGRLTKYGHLKKILVKRGQKVKRGETIGLLGNTGRSTGPHVHYEIRVNGTPVNPLKHILN